MDNLTHWLTGWALGQAGLKTKTRKGLAALILGANMPDIDVFFGWVPWEPLAMHRGFTHGLVGGVLVMPPMLCRAVAVARPLAGEARRDASRAGLPMHFGWLLALCYIGALTHPLLDLQTTYSVQLLSPLRARLVSMPTACSSSTSGCGPLLGRVDRLEPLAREARPRAWQRPVQGAMPSPWSTSPSISGSARPRPRRSSARIPHATAIFASPPPVWFWQSLDELARGPLDRPRRIRAIRSPA